MSEPILDPPSAVDVSTFFLVPSYNRTGPGARTEQNR